jgi:hypothetical protein
MTPEIDAFGPKTLRLLDSACRAARRELNRKERGDPRVSEEIARRVVDEAKTGQRNMRQLVRSVLSQMRSRV